MHSKIIQISREPIKKDNYIDESRYYDHWFVGSIADYVSDLDDNCRTALCKNLSCDAFELDPVANTLSIISKDAYFKPKYDAFKAKLQEISQWEYEDYREPHYEVSWLADLYDDKFGFYIDDNGEFAGLETLDAFMRRAEDGDIYYIGALLDYHF